MFHLYRQIIIEFLIGWSAVLLFKQEGKEILHHLYLFLQFYYPNVVVINTYSVYATLLIYSLLKASVLIYSVIKAKSHITRNNLVLTLLYEQNLTMES